MIEGTVKTYFVNFLDKPRTGNVISVFYLGAKIKADTHQFQWLHIIEINGEPTDGWANAGVNQQYISWNEIPVVVDPPPIPTDKPTVTGATIVLEYDDDTISEPIHLVRQP